MTSTTPTDLVARSGASATRRWAQRHGWSVGVWVLLGLMVVYYATLIPKFGSFEIASIAKNSLPLAYLAVAQAIIVIAGGIDLGIGALMVLGNVAAARFMDEQSFGMTVVIAILIVLALAVIDGFVGLIISVSKVPDIVITLATSFIIAGLALVVLPSPGGGTSEGFRFLFTGSKSGITTNFWPAMIILTVPVAVVAIWIGKTRNGLSLYGIGSDPHAAYLSGINTRRAKVLSYAVGGAFAAMAGLATTAITGAGDPRFSIGGIATLNSVAAIVLGGIALTGGVGSVIGAVAAGIILFFLNPILTAMGVDPNTAQVIQGVLIVVVMAIAGLLALRRRRAS